MIYHFIKLLPENLVNNCSSEHLPSTRLILSVQALMTKPFLSQQSSISAFLFLYFTEIQLTRSALWRVCLSWRRYSYTISEIFCTYCLAYSEPGWRTLFYNGMPTAHPQNTGSISQWAWAMNFGGGGRVRTILSNIISHWLWTSSIDSSFSSIRKIWMKVINYFI